MSSAAHPIAAEENRPLLREEYDRLVELGAFQDEKLELLHGQLVRMTPQGPQHFSSIYQLGQLLAAALGARAFVRVQGPIALGVDSEPEPDVAVVLPSADRYAKSHPTGAQTLLVIEVAATSARRDREVKGGLYAAAGVPEFWLVDLKQRCVEVHTVPLGAQYTQVELIRSGGALRPQAFGEVTLRVDDVLPPL